MNRIQVLLMFLMISINSIAQEQNILPLNTTTGKVSYSAVVHVRTQTKEELFQKSKKWIKTKHSETHPYTISYEDAQSGSITIKGSFVLPIEDRKYTVTFVMNIDTKEGKYRYDLSDIVIEYTTKEGVSTGGYAMWSSTTYREVETLSYSIETFYPIRLEKKRKPSIKWYEPIREKYFKRIDTELKMTLASFKDLMKKTTSNW